MACTPPQAQLFPMVATQPRLSQTQLTPTPTLSHCDHLIFPLLEPFSVLLGARGGHVLHRTGQRRNSVSKEGEEWNRCLSQCPFMFYLFHTIKSLLLNGFLSHSLNRCLQSGSSYLAPFTHLL